MHAASRSLIAERIIDQGREISATPRHTSTVPASLKRVICSFRMNFAPSVVMTKLREVAGRTKLRSAHERTARNAKKLHAMKNRPIKKFRFVRTRAAIEMSLRG